CYGKERADALFAQHIGNSALTRGSDIKARQFKALVDAGDQWAGKVSSRTVNHLQALAKSSGKQLGEVFNMATLGTGIQAQRLCARATAMLSSAQYTQPALGESLEELKSLRKELSEFTGSYESYLREAADQDQENGGLTVDAFEALRADIQTLDEQLKHKQQLMERQIAAYPNTVASLARARMLMYDAIIQTLDPIIRSLPPNAPQEQALKAERNRLVMLKAEDFNRLNDTGAVSKEEGKAFKNLPSTLAAGVYWAFQAAGYVGGANELSKHIAQLYYQRLNQEPWPTIRRNIPLVVGGREYTVQSTITPASQTGGAVARSHLDAGINGVCSSSTSSKLPVNLARTEVTVAGADPQNQIHFVGLRHGVHCAFGVRDKTTRETANDERVKATLLMTLESQPALLQAVAGGQIVSLPMTSICLMTPDTMRSTGLGGKLFGAANREKMFVQEQTEAWRRVDGQDIRLTLSNGQTATVRPQILTFNFGVNEWAQAGAVKQALGGGWSVSGEMNRTAMDYLKARISAFLANAPPGVKRTQVEQLRDQIEQLWTSGAYRDSSKNPYLLPSRIAVITSLMDGMPLFNCKSGKDRTGQMDVEIKRLVTRMSMDPQGNVPSPEYVRTEEEQRIDDQIAINSGNHEMQMYNTGLAGFKTKGVAGLDATFSPEAMAVHRGLSSYVKA
ncbi:MAG: hypothetical protein IK129_02555, partial [Deltaproteobacteria bacterium]|nr:hypothetical protein [Deltaproteobacteria bacterium]